MKRIGEYIAYVMIAHALLVGLGYLIHVIREPGRSSAVGLGMLGLELLVGIGVWHGVRRRIGGVYRFAIRVGLIGVGVLAVARFVERDVFWLGTGELLGIGIPLLAALLAFLAYSRALVLTALPGYCDYCGRDITDLPVPVCRRCGRCTSERLNERFGPVQLQHCFVLLTAPAGIEDPLRGVDLTQFEVHEDQGESLPIEGLRIEAGGQRVWIFNCGQSEDGRDVVDVCTRDGARTSLDLLVRLRDVFVDAGYEPDERDDIEFYREILSEDGGLGNRETR